MMRSLPCWLLLALVAACSTAGRGPGERWELTDPAAWRVGADELELHGVSAYEPPYRSPLSLAVLRDATFDDFDFEVEARSTCREYGHRDLVIVFAYRDAAHYAYAHFATAADANAHHVMLVDGAPRRPVTVERTTGVVWGDQWHLLEVRRRGESVEVFFDRERVMTAVVPVGRGRVGVGSFDDTGVFRALAVRPR